MEYMESLSLVTEAFEELLLMQIEITMQTVKWFVVPPYDHT